MQIDPFHDAVQLVEPSEDGLLVSLLQLYLLLDVLQVLHVSLHSVGFDLLKKRSLSYALIEELLSC